MNMRAHCTEGELILYHYGEARRCPAIQRHLVACEECRATYGAVAGTLTMMGTCDVPARGDQYGLEVWQRIRHELPEPGTEWWSGDWFRRDRIAMAAVASGLAAVAAVAFIAGRVWPHQPPVVSPGIYARVEPGHLARSDGTDVRQRVLLAAVADHLDRSDRMLTEIMNGPRRSDISTEQAWAEDLLTTNRLYRQDALDGDERAVAGVLDELERSLLEIAHTSSHINQATLDPLRQRIDAAALLFKVRVMSDQLRQRASIPAERIVPYTSTRTPS